MKNILKSKAFPITALSVACIGVLAISLFIGREERTDFRPEEPAPETAIQEWTETPTTIKQPADSGNGGTSGAYAASQSPVSEKDLTAYPKTVEETDQLVTIDFTPEAEKLQPEPPKTPVTEADTGDPEQPPVYTPEELEPPVTTAPVQPDTPAAGTSNGNGAVYDPVFGWVVPGNVSQTAMDSTGDPDKMVGNMGN